MSGREIDLSWPAVPEHGVHERVDFAPAVRERLPHRQSERPLRDARPEQLGALDEDVRGTGEQTYGFGGHLDPLYGFQQPRVPAEQWSMTAVRANSPSRRG